MDGGNFNSDVCGGSGCSGRAVWLVVSGSGVGVAGDVLFLDGRACLCSDDFVCRWPVLCCGDYGGNVDRFGRSDAEGVVRRGMGILGFGFWIGEGGVSGVGCQVSGNEVVEVDEVEKGVMGDG